MRMGKNRLFNYVAKMKGSTKSPLAQPRNLLGGHIVSAFIGESTYDDNTNWQMRLVPHGQKS